MHLKKIIDYFVSFGFATMGGGFEKFPTTFSIKIKK